MRRDDHVRPQHMLDAAREAISFVSGRTRDQFAADRMLALAVVKEIEIIGEAASKVSAETRTQLPRIPWPDVVGIRNRLIHAYFDVDYDRVWVTVTESLPELVAQLEPSLAGV